jgi:integrase
VRRKVAELRRQHAVGELVPPTKVTVGEHLAAWLEAGAGDWKPKTLCEYESVVRVYLAPAFGRVRLQQLTAPQVTAQYARWRKERDIAGGTLLNVHRVLHRALRIAVRQGLVARNVADAVEPPKAIRRRPELWSADEAARFLGSEPDARWGALWSFLLGTGCRLGEAVGMTWADFDRDAGKARIARSVTWVHCVPVEGVPKTASGVRTITLPDFTLAALRAWRAVQAAERLAAGAEWRGGDKVFTTPAGELPAPWVCAHALARACKRAGLPRLRVHDLRHMHASILLARGLPLPAVSARLGHASPAVTASVYSHALRGQDDAAARAVQGALAAG